LESFVKDSNIEKYGKIIDLAPDLAYNQNILRLSAKEYAGWRLAETEGRGGKAPRAENPPQTALAEVVARAGRRQARYRLNERA
jgi:hypothetical protein